MRQRLYSPGVSSPRRNRLVPGILAIAGTTFAAYAVHGAVSDAMRRQAQYELSETPRATALILSSDTRHLRDSASHSSGEGEVANTAGVMPVTPLDLVKAEMQSARSIAVGGASISALPPRSQRSRMVPGENPGQPNHGASFPVAGENLTPSDVHETKASAEWTKTRLVTWKNLKSKDPGIVQFDRKPEAVWITTYADKYDGRKARDGSVYRHDGLTCAVPRSMWRMYKGHYLAFKLNGRTVEVKVTDSCGWIKGREVKNFDLSRYAWNRLTKNAKPSRVKAQMEVLR